MIDRDQEIREAILAGETALRCLRNAQTALNSAGNWGIFDMLGGGMISTFVKHSKIDAAKQELEQSRHALWQFQAELEDVNQLIRFDVNIGDFLKFADYFFDNFFVDWMVQSKIGDAKRQVSQLISKIERILGELRRQL